MPKIKKDHPKFGKRIIELRKKHNMTQDDLAEALQTKRTTISYFENQAENPTFETIEKFAKIFKLTTDEFFNSIDDQPKKGGPKSRLEKLTEEIKKMSAYKQNLILDMLEGAITNSNNNSK